MPAIDIVTMRGETPRVAPHLLPNEVATVAKNCIFDRGTLAPLMDDLATGLSLPITPKTLFHYRDNFWFAWAGDVEVMRSPIAHDTYGRIYYTDGIYPKVTTADIATGGATKPTAWYRLGVSAPTTAIQIGAITPPAGATDDNTTDDVTRFYVETYVTGTGEEGPPGPVSSEVTITIPNSSVTLTLMPPGSSDRNIQQRRIYRSATSDSASDWLLVVELPIGAGTFVDSKTEAQLSASLETSGYLPPPDNMRGLCLMANGIAAGFAGNELLFSEAYLPYAWPKANRLTTEHKIVAIAAIGTSLVVGTEGYPYVCSGVSPSSITAQKIDLQQACISKQSMVAMDGLVLYASPDGLAGVGADGGQVVTEQIITREQWQAMSPATLRGWYHEGKYIGQTDTHGFIYDPKIGDFRELSNRWDAAYNDMLRDELYLVKGMSLYRWRRDTGTTIDATWRSKVFTLPPGTSLSSAVLVADDVAKLAFKVWADGSLLLSLPKGGVPVTGFRLPASRATRWQIEVSGQSKVHRITLASSMAELNR